MIFKTPNAQHCAVDLIKLYDNTLDPVEMRRFLLSFRQNVSLSSARTDLCGSYALPLDVYSASPRLLLYFLTAHYAEITGENHLTATDRSMWFWSKEF